MTLRLKKRTPKIRNIKLVHDDDEDYCDFMTNIKLDHFHLRPRNQRLYVDIVGYPLEKTVREWAKESGAELYGRILSYELLHGNRYEKRFKEIDLVYRIADKHFLVEVKVSSSRRALPKASRQLRDAFSILSKADFDLELMIVHIDLNYKNVKSTFHSFNENFLENDSKIIEGDVFSYNYIHLSPHDIFQWGLKKGIILYDNLLPLAIEEADCLHAKRIKRQKLSKQQIPQSKWPAELRNEATQHDEENHFASFGENVTQYLLAEKLREAMKKKF